jgi:TolB-like protein
MYTDDTTVLRFGIFELHVDLRTLRMGGKTIRLQEQPFAILRLLLERRGRVVTRDELRETLWPAGTFVDFEHSLNAAVKRLRAALGDDADDPRFIETIPRRGYRFIADLQGQEAVRPRIRLAVLPFLDLLPDANGDFFSRGFTEELISELGRRSGTALAVISSHSSLAFRNTTASTRTIASLLRADYLLEGTIQRSHERVRVTARLIETAGETQMWVDTRTHAAADWLAAQSDIAARIASSLAVELVPRQPTSDSDQSSPAYDAYLKGRYHWHRVADSGANEALRFFTESVRLDPGLAVAHAGLALSLEMRAWYYWDVPRRVLEQAQDAAARALELDPGLAEAHVADGEVRRLLWLDSTAARAAYERAIALNPSFETARGALARLLVSAGQVAEAVRQADIARELDLRCLTANYMAAWARYVGGDYDSAIALCHHSLEMDDTHLWAKLLLGSVLLTAGSGKEAVRVLGDAANQSSDPVAFALLAWANARSGKTSVSRDFISAAESTSHTRYVSPYYLAVAYAALGDADTAFRMLTRAGADRDPALLNLGVDPRLDTLRSDPRCAEIVRRLGVEDVNR